MVSQISWGADTRPPIQLPEVVIIGQDPSLLKSARDKQTPLRTALSIKEAPSGEKEKLLIRDLQSESKTAPDVTNPGCLFGNIFTRSIAKAFIGDEAQYKIGLYQYYNRDYAGAIEAFSLLEKESPKSLLLPSALYWKAEAYYQLGQQDQALKEFKYAAELFPQGGFGDYALYSAGWLSLSQHLYQEAANYFAQFLSLHSGSGIVPAVQFLYGETLFELDKYEEAAKIYEAFLEKFPQSRYATDAQFWRAESLYRAGQFAKARELYQQFMKAYPKNPRAEDAFYSIGWSLVKLNDFSAALETFGKFLTDYPQSKLLDSILYGRVKTSLGLGNIERANQEYGQLLDRFPKSPWLDDSLTEIGWYYFEKGNYPRAIEVYQALLKPGFGDEFQQVATFVVGESYYQQGLYEKALPFFTLAEALQDKRLAEHSSFRKALSFLHLKRDGEAASQLEKYLKEFPGSAFTYEARFWLAEARSGEKKYAEALEAYKSIPQESARYEDALYGKGWVSYQQGKWKEASQEFETFVKDFQGSAFRVDALYRLAECYFNLKNHDGSIATYKQVIAEYPQHQLARDALFRIGWVQYRREAFPDAIASLSKFLRENRSSDLADDAQYWLGMAYFSQKDYSNAALEFEELIRKHPKSEFVVPTMLKLGDIAYNETRYRDAIEAYRRVVREAPRDQEVTDAEYGMLISYLQLGDHARFFEGSREFIEKYPSSPLSVTLQYQAGEVLSASKRYNEAIAVYKEVFRRFETSDIADDALLRIADLNLTSGKVSEAIGAYKELLSTFKESELRADAHFGLGRAYQILKDDQAALAEYLDLISNYQGSGVIPQALHNIGVIKANAGEIEEARGYFQKVLQEYPQDPVSFLSHFQLGLLYQKEKRFVESIEYFKVATGSSDPETNAAAQYAIGESYFLMGNFQESGREYLRVVYLYPEQTGWWEKALSRAGESYEKLGKWRDAEAIYLKILNESKSKEFTQMARERIEKIQKNRM
ncbi:MAG: tetratricopeptide repeat protein [Candidatus Tectomicrobia bacterium]|nr:tetratricopeptide repeat protein [Candidatus Tectomicrobia bacterium]